MSFFKNNSLAVALVGAIGFGLVALQGCSSDAQNTPGAGGKTNTGGTGTGGKTSTAGSAGKPVSEGGGAGEEQPSEGGSAGVENAGGEGGTGSVSCDLSFDNSTLEVLTDNGGVLPALP